MVHLVFLTLILISSEFPFIFILILQSSSNIIDWHTVCLVLRIEGSNFNPPIKGQFLDLSNLDVCSWSGLVEMCANVVVCRLLTFKLGTSALHKHPVGLSNIRGVGVSTLYFTFLHVQISKGSEKNGLLLEKCINHLSTKM